MPLPSLWLFQSSLHSIHSYFIFLKTILHINVRPKILVATLPFLSAVKRMRNLPNTYGLMHGFMSTALTSSILVPHHFLAVDFMNSLNWLPPFAPPTLSDFLLAQLIGNIAESRNIERVWKYQVAVMSALVSPPLDFHKREINFTCMTC